MAKSILDSIRHRDPGLATDARDIALAVTVLLLDVAFSDEKISPEEIDRIRTTLSEHFQLADEELRDVLNEARERWSHTSDVWEWVSGLNKNLTENERRQVLNLVWTVIYSDEVLDDEEEYFGYQLAHRLDLSISDVHAAQARARQS